MKLLLVQVPTSHLGAGEKVYPLGLSRLSSLVPPFIEKQVLDMNLCPDPWDRLKQVLESQGPDTYSKSNAYVAAMGIEGKRGCDLHCGYCLYPFLGGPCMRLRSPGKIVDEMERLNKEFNIGLFHFTDAVVNRPVDHFEALCQELIGRKLDLAWTGFFREESLNAPSLDLAMKAGLTAIYFSGDALTGSGLKLLRKNLTSEDILGAARLTAEKKILTMCHFLVNLPGENPENIQEASQMLDRLLEIHGPAGNLGAVIFNHVRLYPNAPLTEKLIRSGTLDSQTDFLYPVYHNPARFSHILHEFETRCHRAGIFSRLGLDPLVHKEMP